MTLHPPIAGAYADGRKPSKSGKAAASGPAGFVPCRPILDGAEFRLIEDGDWADCACNLWKRRHLVRGVSYFTCPEHVDDDTCKIGHVAMWPNGTIRRLDWSPYSVMSACQFGRLMRLGFPGGVAYENELTALEAAARLAA